MFKFIRSLLKRFHREPTPRQELAAFLEAVRGVGPNSMGGHLAAAALARKTLDATRMVSLPFPADVFAGEVPLDAAAVERLTAYAIELRRFKVRCLADNTTLTTAVARGLDVWIASIWTLTLPAQAEGKEMWALLARGNDFVDSAYRFMLKREPSDVERGFFSYRPQIFFD